MNQPSLLAFGPGRWLRDPARLSGSPRYHLAGLARLGWRVVYIQPPWRLRRTKDSFAFDLGADALGELIVIDPSFVPPFAPRFAPQGWLGEFFRSVTSRRLTQVGRAALARPDVVWLGAPWHGLMAGAQDAGSLKVWHLYDELDLSPTLPGGARRWLATWSQQLADRVDLILASSSAQVARWANRKETVLLGNAVRDDFGMPDDAWKRDQSALATVNGLADLPRPLAIYGGVADDRMDRAILQQLIAHWRGTVVLAGTLAPSLKQWLSEKDLLCRLHCTGTLPYCAFPSVYQHADVLVLMHQRNPFTDAMWPEKLNEYLMVGKPIVSVRIPEVARIAALLPADAIRLADTPEAFVAACQLAAGGDALSTARHNLAREFTWSARARQLDAILRARLGRA